MPTKEQIENFNFEEERREALEHRDVLLAIAAIIKIPQGIKLFRYFFKSFDITKLPPQEMEGNLMHEYLGFLRAGNSIYKLACEADAEGAASILSKLERERYDRITEQHRLEQDTNDTD